MISEQLRLAIERSGRSAYQLAKETGQAPQGIRRFLKGERGLSLENVDAIAEQLDLCLVARVADPKQSPSLPTPDWERKLEDRAWQLAIKIVQELLDNRLSEVITELRSQMKDRAKGGASRKDHDSDPRHTREGL